MAASYITSFHTASGQSRMRLSPRDRSPLWPMWCTTSSSRMPAATTSLVGLEFAWQIPLKLDIQVKPGKGLPFSPFVEDLDWIKDKRSWRFLFFSAIKELSDAEIVDLRRRLEEHPC